MQTSNISNEEFMTGMSYLFPTAENYINKKQLQVPINLASTVASLNRLFKQDNPSGDTNYGYNLWLSDRPEFVRKFMYTYWSDDPLFEDTVDLSELTKINLNARRYIAMSIINMRHRNGDNKLIYDLDSIQFETVDELVELFQFMSNFPTMDYTQQVIDVLGSEMLNGVTFSTTNEIKQQKEQEQLESEEINKQKEIVRKAEFDAKLDEKLAGLPRPIMTQNQLFTGLSELTRKLNELYLKELNIRRESTKQICDLNTQFESRLSEEGAFKIYMDNITELNTERKRQIKEVYVEMAEMQKSAAILSSESHARNIYESVSWSSAVESLSALKGLEDGFGSPLVLVNESDNVIDSVVESVNGNDNVVESVGESVSESV
jgi:hypothetical protein